MSDKVTASFAGLQNVRARRETRIDELVSEAFTAIATGLPAQARYQAFVPLLDGLGDWTPGYDRAEIMKRIHGSHSAEESATLDDLLVALRKRLSISVDADYAVASYWSPVDSRRHTVIHGREVAGQSREYRLRCAYAFYAVTFAGLSRNLFSLIQFIAERAVRKTGITTVFADEAGTESLVGNQPVLRIGASAIPEVFEAAGFRAFLQSLEETGLSAAEVEAALAGTLRNATGVAWQDVAGLADAFVEQFQSACDRLAIASRADTANACATLSEALGTPVSPEQFLFIVGTQLLWREAFPTNLMYSFPVSLVGSDSMAGTCCVLTVGTSAVLTPAQETVLALVARSLFFEPLVHDYAWRHSDTESRAMATRRMHIYRRLLGHNLPKFLIRPSATELRRIEQQLEYGVAADRSLMAAAAQRLRFLFRHYDAVLAAIMKSTTMEQTFSEPAKAIALSELVTSNAGVAIDIMRNRVGENLRRTVSLSLDIAPDVRALAHPEFVIEMLFNLISNAVEALDPVVVDSDPNRGIIRVRLCVDETARVVVLTVADRGVGMHPEARRRFEAAAQSLRDASRLTFWECADRLVEEALVDQAHDEHMGIGLLFCALYLLSLRWQPGVLLPGDVRIMSIVGDGTEIALTLPQSAA